MSIYKEKTRHSLFLRSPPLPVLRARVLFVLLSGILLFFEQHFILKLLILNAVLCALRVSFALFVTKVLAFLRVLCASVVRLLSLSLVAGWAAPRLLKPDLK
jgi:lysylphosphatidylglycerol synthetase-like protein (DUF2156 family)